MSLIYIFFFATVICLFVCASCTVDLFFFITLSFEKSRETFRMPKKWKKPKGAAAVPLLVCFFSCFVQVASSESKCTEFHCLMCSNPSSFFRWKNHRVLMGSLWGWRNTSQRFWTNTKETHDFFDTLYRKQWKTSNHFFNAPERCGLGCNSDWPGGSGWIQHSRLYLSIAESCSYDVRKIMSKNCWPSAFVLVMRVCNPKIRNTVFF